ncbi:MAG TPA: sigma 54-interacting transcriptional regulator [Steroidobacteraceae bacterium]|nr:sigma 54-interacting transcriptional regulator [Steroidobacteraceae bacterium]
MTTPAQGLELRAVEAVLEAATLPTGEGYFAALAARLAAALDASGAWIARHEPPDPNAKVLGARSHADVAGSPASYPLDDMPCRFVIDAGRPRHVEVLPERFPGAGTIAPGAASYLGVPLLGHDGLVLGVACVVFDAPTPEHPRRTALLQALVARAAAELDRLRIGESLRASEDRFRDLFDEAPIAYVIEDLESRFIRANRTAMRTLGITPDQVHGTVGMSFIPDTPEAQRRVREAFDSINRGTDMSGVVLELRRRDDGRPLFIQWWSRPEPGGTYTRTMFIDITDKVLMEREQARLQAQNRYLQEEIKSVHNFDEIIGRSTGLARVLEDVSRVAPTDATVLILGETGTGKELIARAIHSRSRRADKPFIKLNCAALPSGLIESELFGHEKGAFSGALQRRLGRFELANGGTIFLDEIGEMPLDVQSKLLRVLQEQEFERVGSSHTLKTDVRVIAATNRDLPTAIGAGEFRQDLYYRLNVFPVGLPPLRDRADDIPLLVQHFVEKYAPRVGRTIEAISRDAIEQLQRYAWPGNIRELENLVERGLILATSTEFCVAPAMLPSTAPPLRPAPVASAPVAVSVPRSAARDTGLPVEADLNAVQREHILQTLQATHWVIEGERGAARRLGLKPATLRHRMKKLGISRAAQAAVDELH